MFSFIISFLGATILLKKVMQCCILIIFGSYCYFVDKSNAMLYFNYLGSKCYLCYFSCIMHTSWYLYFVS